MKTNFKVISILFTLILLLFGCASTKQSVKSEPEFDIHKIGLIISQTHENVQFMDHTNSMPGSYVGYQYGALGGLIEGTVIAVQQNKKLGKSLGASTFDVEERLPRIEIENVLREKIIKRLSKKYEVEIIEKADSKKNLHAIYDADTIMKIGFVYGVAAYETDSASPAVVADIKVETNDFSKKTMINKRLMSDNYYRSNGTLDDFAKNDAELFRTAIDKATEIMALLVAAEVGIDKEQVPDSNFTESMNLIAASCSKPYELTEDCSFFTGAKRNINIEGVEAKIAGTSDGNVILLMAGSHILNSLKDGLTLGLNDTRSKPSEQCLQAVKSILNSNNIKIIKTIKLVSYGAVSGYFLKLDRDGYSVLKKYSL